MLHKSGSLMIFRRLFAVIGVALVLVGVFMPFLAIPLFRDESFFELTARGSWIVIGLMAISAACTVIRRFGLLYIAGLGTAGLVVYTMYQVNARKTGYLTDFQEALAGSPLKGIGISFVNSVDFTHGAAIMLAGAVILICVPLLGDRIIRRRKSDAGQ